MLEQATSVRDYTESQIAPLLAGQDQQRFLPQTIPFYAAETTMRALAEKFPDYSYKEAALNPTNPADRAVDWEAGMIDAFRRNPALASYSITREFAGRADLVDCAAGARHRSRVPGLPFHAAGRARCHDRSVQDRRTASAGNSARCRVRRSFLSQ